MNLPMKSSRVSIPYEREGAWKAEKNYVMIQNLVVSFQFPTNGKGHGKRKDKLFETLDRQRVSIPYEREGAWKGIKYEPVY